MICTCCGQKVDPVVMLMRKVALNAIHHWIRRGDYQDRDTPQFDERVMRSLFDKETEAQLRALIGKS